MNSMRLLRSLEKGVLRAENPSSIAEMCVEVFASKFIEWNTNLRAIIQAAKLDRLSRIQCIIRLPHMTLPCTYQRTYLS